jgi:AcrR family transcriptional regulator
MSGAQRQSRLTRERVLDGAVELADEIGIDALTIRRLASALEVKPMTIYHHVPSKEAIVDGMVELVFAEIEMPPNSLEWKASMRVRCVSARDVLNRHPWAAPLMESRTQPGPANLGHHDAVLGTLKRGGLSPQMMAHAYAVLDSFIYGFAFEEATLPTGDSGDFSEMAQEISATFDPVAYPNLVDFTVDHVMQPGYDFGDSFEFGLDLILDALERAAQAES